MKSNAPELASPRRPCSTVPCPEMMTTGSDSFDCANPLQHLEAVHARHLDVEKDEVGRVALDRCASPSGPARRLEHVVPSYSRIIRTESRIAASSSTTRMRALHRVRRPSVDGHRTRAGRARDRSRRTPATSPDRAAATRRWKSATDRTGWRLISMMMKPRRIDGDERGAGGSTRATTTPCTDAGISSRGERLIEIAHGQTERRLVGCRAAAPG